MGKLRLRIFNFLFVGLITFAVYYVLIWVTHSLMQWPYPVAIFISYFLAVTFHFFSNRRLTFKQGHARMGIQLLRYVQLSGVNYAVQVAVVYLCYDLFNLTFYLSVFLGVTITTITGFVVLDRWVFCRT